MADVLKSLTFRYIAKYVTTLSAAVFLLLAILYSYFSYGYFTELREAIVDELDSLQLVYRGQGLGGLEQYLNDQHNLPTMGRYSYLIVDQQDRKIAGDLAQLPRYREFSDGWVGFQMALLNWGEPVDVDFLARQEPLGDGYVAIVARNYADAVAGMGLVFNTLFRAMIATLLLGIAGGFFSAATALKRFEKLNIELADIVRHNSRQRLSVEDKKGYPREMAQAMNQMLDQIASLMQGVKRVSDNIAHDLRTPLTRIRNHLSQLRARLDPAGQDDIDRVIEECDGLLSSFNALLRISALESGGSTTFNSGLFLPGLLADVVELYEPVASDKGVTLRLRVGNDTAQCAGDSDLLFQMCANLLDNAIKYTPANGHIDVTLATREPAAVEITVADTGPGIDAGERESVFRRFYRVESSRGEQPGHGLGLSLVQAIVHYHHGAITLADNEPGLRVVVQLPGVIPPA
ncbi:two-component sensor histidine kinase [Kineobactrum sediminis]|uniref:histidine kinase n=1 Tax=Kineobactrum sediminis TaxID=1905677 RepID=A0A2N5Y3Z0_9GAMM|nr:two-component sensor histidine kinase [Kineobactrum sediminis]